MCVSLQCKIWIYCFVSQPAINYQLNYHAILNQSRAVDFNFYSSIQLAGLVKTRVILTYKPSSIVAATGNLLILSVFSVSIAQESSESKDVESQSDAKLSKRDTLYGLNKELDMWFYDVGIGIHNISFNLHSKTISIDPKEHLKIHTKFKVSFYYGSSMVYICQADGILGSKEKEFIRMFIMGC